MSGVPVDLPPLVMTSQGPLPQTPISLDGQLIELVSQTNPGYTANLPGSLIEDISSTDVGALILIDRARVETINSLTPYGANAFVLNALGQVYGVQLGKGSNATVDVVFTGTINFPVAQGFTVSDGNHQYTTLEGTIVQGTGSSPPVTALCTAGGTFPIPANTVTTLITSVPTGYSLTVTNPIDGIPSTGPQTIQSYRAQVLQAGLAASTGMTRYLKTLLLNVPGVQQNLVSARAQTGGGWEIIVGGGDLAAVANAIFLSLFDVSQLVGSVMSITGITNANPGVVTTLLNHGLLTGATNVHIAGVVGMTGVNGGPYTITVISEKTFSFGVDTTSVGSYVSGGVVTPNPRNAVVTVLDYPDSYNIPIVLPPAQVTVVSLTWGTVLTGFTGASVFAQLAVPAIVSYISGIAVGNPINLSYMQALVADAVSSVIQPQYITRWVWAVSINGVPTAPAGGTFEVIGDPESYFSILSSAVTIIQG